MIYFNINIFHSLFTKLFIFSLCTLNREQHIINECKRKVKPTISLAHLFIHSVTIHSLHSFIHSFTI